MTPAAFLPCTALMIAGLLGSQATADQPLTCAQLSTLLSGNTLYVEMPVGAPGAPDGGTAPIYYGADGAAIAQLPAGVTLVGTWALVQDHYCIDWQNGPQNSCSTLQRGPEGFRVMDVAQSP